MPRSLADLIEDRFALPTELGKDMPAEGPLARILARRTHRRYTDQPISDELLDVLFACAFSASAKSDLQQAGVVVVKDPEERAVIADLIPRMPWVRKAPVFMIWVGDNRRIRRICEMRGKPFANDHLDSFLNAAVDCALAMQTFILSAEAAGLGCCPISVVRNHAARIAELLELPDWVFPVAGLCVGWPADDASISLRLPRSLTVHTDRYDDSRLPDEVDGYDRRRHARQPIAPEEQRHRREYGTAAFYGWSEDKARQVSKSERADFGRFVRGQSFRLD